MSTFLKQFDVHPSPKSVLIHGCCWLLIISLELSILIHMTGKLAHPFQYFFYYGVNILIFYSQILSLNYAGPVDRKNWLLTVFRFITIILIFLLIKGFVSWYFFEEKGLQPFLMYTKAFLPENIYRNVYFSILALFFWGAGYLQYYRAEKLESEKSLLAAEKIKTELENKLGQVQNAYYRQQVNPHMLFNALNFVYDKTYRLSQPAGDVLMLLADIMRYSLDPVGADNRVPLDDEIQQIRNLIKLNEYRFEKRMHVEFMANYNSLNLRVLPLVMATLVENVFKHGDLTDAAKPASIRVDIEGVNTLVFTTSNQMKAPGRTQKKTSQGIDNVRIRMEHAYGADFKFVTASQGERFETFLSFPG